MYQHFILTYSSYSYSKRVAFHRTYETLDKIKEFLTIAEDLKKEFDGINFGFHHIQTNQESWQSVIEYDRFFCDVEEVKTVEVFRKIVSDDTKVKPMDIARLILSKRDCTQIDLQKLIYFTVCEHISMTGEVMFEDDFQAWTYGPVLPEIYGKFKKYKSKKIKLMDKETAEGLIYSRVSKLKDGDTILKAVEKTLEKYGNFTSAQLVEKSHEEDGPWDIVNNSIGSNIIPKALIIEYVQNKKI